MAEHPPRNDDKKSAKQRGGRSHPKGKGTIDALVAELNNIQSRNSLKKVGADVVTPEGAAAAGIDEASTVPPELKQIYGDAPVPPDKVAILKKIKGKEKIASFLAQTAADVAEKKSSAGNVEVNPPQTEEASKLYPELSSEVSALTSAVSKLYEKNVALDNDNSLRKILDAIPDEAIRENLKSKGLKISYRDSKGKVVPPNMMGSLMFVQLANDPSGEGWTFPTSGQINSPPMFDWFGGVGKEIISRPVKSRLVGDAIELINKDERRHSPITPAPAHPESVVAPTVEVSPTPQLPESELDKIKEAIVRGDKALGRTGGFVLKSLSEMFYTGSENEKIEIITLFANNKDKIREAIGGTRYLDSFFDDLTMRAETYAPEIAQRNVTSSAEVKSTQTIEPVPQPQPEVATEQQPKNASLLAEAIANAEKGRGTAEFTPLYNREEFLQKYDALDADFHKLYPQGVPANVDDKWRNKGNDVFNNPAFNTDQKATDDEILRRAQVFVEKQRLELEERKHWPGDVRPAEETPVVNPENTSQTDTRVVLDPEDIRNPDKPTSGESRSKLRELVGKLVGKTTEKFDWYKSSKEGLIRRNEELDTQMEAIGGKLKIERGFRWMGEKYNKLPFKYKLALGATLGLGTVLTSGTLAVAFPLLGIATQRAAGLATMYMKFEKQSHDEKWGRNEEWGKQKAMLKAGLYTVLLGLTMKEAIEYASGTELAHAAQAKVEGFLGWMMGHTASPQVASVPEAPIHVAAPPTPEAPIAAPPVAPLVETTTAPAIQEPAAAAAAVETVAPVTATELPSIEAKAGDGYERMLKHLIDELPENPPTNMDPDSDLSKLFEAKAYPETIDSAIHKLATENEFYKADGTSVRINVGDKMTIDTDGHIWLGEDILAPDNAPVTPAIHTVTPTNPSVQFRPDISEGADSDVNAVGDVAVLSDQESVPIEQQPVPNVKVSAPEADVKVDLTAEQEAIARASETITASPDSVSAETPTQSPAPVIEKSFITNQFGLAIPVAESHIYADEGAKNLFVYGGSAQERGKAMLEYLLKNPSKIIFGADADGKYRLPWHLVDGEVTPAGLPPRTGGLFGTGFLSEWMKSPKPNDLRQIIT